MNENKEDEYKPKKFDFEKGGIFTSHPPEGYGLTVCITCKMIIESKDWESATPKCEDCKKIKAKAIIVDLDSTLLNVDHRLHHITHEEPRNFKDFRRKIPQDTINQWCLDLVKGFDENDYIIIILTARMDIDGVRKMTFDQLDEFTIPHDVILMREGEDFRKGWEVKQELYEEYIKGRYDVKLVIDDRPDIIHMFQKHGLQTLLVGHETNDWVEVYGQDVYGDNE